MKKDIFTLDNFVRILILIILVLIFYPIYWLGSLDVESTLQPFNSKKWKDDGGESDVRELMLENLLDNKKVYKGMKKKDVIILLGYPDTKRCGGIGDKSESILSYRIRVDFSTCSLDIYLDDKDKVINFERCCN